ncbi:UDP-GlcNAc transferase associated protein Alg14 [Schizosaccharomyces japonicus yFS275]|uniref:UDP-N-acetylglucosamine transferase subunit ALG14 n=1 Tax=Schizosaccharomyces japonicus (strain yFS275 / FY16936) TaxID=402676 RepID=B6K7U9_SCHJY|nr:UDP-GlcNAc transferase associated protein Alg14 [Schizosaccharomyces japonicus yFS275]EEB09603.1 UDP-GlcNAc transferase associated protein Alg14 [Schizosaccharomyces japonicus yFS275]
MRTILLISILLLFPCLPILLHRTTFASESSHAAEKHLLAFFGSGGHTAEMMSLLNALNSTLYPVRTYVTGRDDKMSQKKAKVLMSQQADLRTQLLSVPRARYVKQSWLTTPFTAFISLFGALRVIFMNEFGTPDVLLCNGPGTCVLICFSAMLARLLGKPIKIVYVESFARVRSLSLSGKILMPFVDRFLVQFPELVEKYKKAEYIGIVA